MKLELHRNPRRVYAISILAMIVISFNPIHAYSSIFSNTIMKPKGTFLRHASLDTNLRMRFDDADADMMEMIAGGRKCDMVDLPDRLVDTTIFVGNLCEFVTDDMLSSLFQEASSLHSVPACVVRKANTSSLKYGFVTFPSLQEKEKAVIRFTGYTLNSRRMKVEEIDLDNPRRSRVPEYFVAYLVGETKPTRDGNTNTMRRRVLNPSGNSSKKKKRVDKSARKTQKRKTLNWQ